MQNPRARTDALIVEELQDEVLVYDSTNKRAHCLGATAARLWRLCDGTRDVEALAYALELSADEVTAGLDELEASELLDAGALKVLPAESSSNDGITRRQFSWRTAKAGTAVVAAPLIYSINVSPAMATLTPTPFQCQLYTVKSCGTDSACGKIAGCCCCCQGGGSCKTCGATAFCNLGTQPCSPVQGGGFGAKCSSVGKDPADARGCCGVDGADNCGCGFGPYAGCFNQNTGVACTPSSANLDCYPGCNGVKLTSSAALGCCKSATVDCCSPGAPTCCAKSSLTVDCCGPNPAPCCATPGGC